MKFRRSPRRPRRPRRPGKFPDTAVRHLARTILQKLRLRDSASGHKLLDPEYPTAFTEFSGVIMHRTKMAWLALGSAAILAGCERTPQVPGQQTMSTGEVQRSALATYVKPGNLDDYYLFYSGG